MNITPHTKIAIVGCGKMGEAILKGWVTSDAEPVNALSGSNIVVVEPSADKQDFLVSTYGVDVKESVSDLGQADMVVIAVKPQVISGVLQEIAHVLPQGEETLVVSIAAGIATQDIEDSLGDAARIVRVMPNLPLQVGQGASVVAAGASATKEDAELVNELFSALGTSHVVDEAQIDAVCAISGGGPAYVAYMVESLRDAGVSCGLSFELAEDLALQTVGGTYTTMAASHMSPEKMREAVCSPGGTTLAAIGALDAAGFKPMFKDAVEAAIDRACELREGAHS